MFDAIYIMKNNKKSLKNLLQIKKAIKMSRQTPIEPIKSGDIAKIKRG